MQFLTCPMEGGLEMPDLAELRKLGATVYIAVRADEGRGSGASLLPRNRLGLEGGTLATDSGDQIARATSILFLLTLVSAPFIKVNR
jgi:hypothetical protein